MRTTERNERRWLQLDVALCRPDGDALGSARRVFAELAPRLDGWRHAGVVDRFYFMRKPPDLRLRFCGPDPRSALLAPLTASLEALERGGAVARFSVSVYEPETRLFGGPDAMALVHDFFDADTSAWLEMDGLWASGDATLRPEVLTCAVMNELFALLLDATEIWDVWCNVATLVATAPGDVSPGGRAVLPSALRAPAGAGERRVLDRYRRANDAFACGLLAVRQAGRLECGLRAMLAFVALFHFHRYGLDGPKQAAIAEAMRRAWSPRDGLRGGDDERRATSST